MRIESVERLETHARLYVSRLQCAGTGEIPVPSNVNIFEDQFLFKRLVCLHDRHHWSDRESCNNNLAPSIGTELEVFDHNIPTRWFTYIDTSGEDLLPEENYANCASETCIPVGMDGAHEFSNAPANIYLTIIREIQELYRHGYLEEGKRYETHISLGGCPYSEELHKLMCLMAACAWSSDPVRLGEHGPYEKGLGGININTRPIRTTPANNINNEIVTEMRVFYTDSLDNISRTLHTVWTLAHAYKSNYFNLDTRLSQEWDRLESNIDLLFVNHRIRKDYYETNPNNPNPSFRGYRLKGVHSVASAMADDGFIRESRRIALTARRTIAGLVYPLR